MDGGITALSVALTSPASSQDISTAKSAPGCSTVAEVSKATRAGTGCGGCHEDIKGLIEKHFRAVQAA